MQNPSDPGASYDGHKGPGYQAQIAETCNPQNEAQLITCAIPQTAAVPSKKFLKIWKSTISCPMSCSSILIIPAMTMFSLPKKKV